jgi:hypothetical protein
MRNKVDIFKLLKAGYLKNKPKDKREDEETSDDN